MFTNRTAGSGITLFPFRTHGAGRTGITLRTNRTAVALRAHRTWNSTDSLGTHGPRISFRPGVAPHALRSAGAGQPGHTAGPDRPRTAWIALWTTWALRTPLTGDPLGALRPALKQFVI